jgi:uncharacterized protein YodC (DUF2158 family)
MVLRAAANRRMPMAFEPGDVVFLKSGGQPMTVAAVEEDSIDCIWVGEEGELFRETIPSIALTAAPADEEELDDEADESDESDVIRITKTPTAKRSMRKRSSRQKAGARPPERPPQLLRRDGGTACCRISPRECVDDHHHAAADHHRVENGGVEV